MDAMEVDPTSLSSVVAVEIDAFDRPPRGRSSRRDSRSSNGIRLAANGNVLIVPSITDDGDWGGLPLRQIAASAFLPAGYPHSVTSDYLGYQIWDTLQALCSYVRGMLTSQALLQGAGVGGKAATPASVVLQFFFRDVVGLLGGVTFAALQGTSFDANAKQWRLAADVANDVGLAVELAAPLFPSAFLAMACIGSVCRAITGVAGGATRMALTQHFALQNNAADIASKEGSQETAVTLFGMILGLGLTRLSTTNLIAAWIAFWLLTVLHVLANVRALRCLNLSRLNRSRLDILLAEFVRIGHALGPSEVAKLESLLPPPVQRALEVLHLAKMCPVVHLAPSLRNESQHARQLIAQALTRADDVNAPPALKQGKYCVVPVRKEGRVVAVLGDGVVNEDFLEAYCVSRLEAWKLAGGINGSPTPLPQTVEKPGVWAARGGCATFLKALRQAGWSTQQPALQQGSSRLQWGAEKARRKDE